MTERGKSSIFIKIFRRIDRRQLFVCRWLSSMEKKTAHTANCSSFDGNFPSFKNSFEEFTSTFVVITGLTNRNVRTFWMSEREGERENATNTNPIPNKERMCNSTIHSFYHIPFYTFYSFIRSLAKNIYYSDAPLITSEILVPEHFFSSGFDFRNCEFNVVFFPLFPIEHTK